MEWYLKVFKQFADFDSRARRTEYWMFTLVNMIIVFFAYIIAFLSAFIHPALFLFFMVILSVYGLVLFIPSLAVVVRRLHDTGKSGWMILVSLIPVIGAIWLLVLLVLDSDRGKNQYGENPKGIE